MNQSSVRPDLARTTLAVLFIGILIAATFWVLQPFLSSFIWAVMIVIATWPMFLKLQARLWGKRWLAVLVMTTLMLLLLIVPLTFAALTIIDRADEIKGWIKSLSAMELKIPPPPEWLGKIPAIGNWATEQWQRFASVSPQELAKLSKSAAPYATKIIGWFAGHAGSFGLLLLHFLLSVCMTTVLYAHGETAAAGARAFARRLAGQQGEDVAVLSAKAVRGVALGIVVTAMVQSSLGGIGLFVAGVPAAILLTALMLFTCVLQIGPSIVLFPAAGWLFWSGDKFTASIFLVWAIFVSTIDNFLRPFLIKKGADLPLLLIIIGVFGGLIAFGIIGLFIGPVILAVAYTLIGEWVKDEPAKTGSKPPVVSLK